MKNNILGIVLFSLFSLTLHAQEPSDTVKIEDVDIDDIDIDDIDIDDIEVDDVDDDILGQKSTFPWSDFSVGGQVGSPTFGSDFTSFDIAPEIVYHINDMISIGADGIFQRTKIKRIRDPYTGIYADTNYKQTNTGGRAFTRIQPAKALPVFVQLEYEGANSTNPYRKAGTQFPSVKQELHNFNAGLGFNNGAYFIGLMYNFMNDKNKEEFSELAIQDAVNRGDAQPGQIPAGYFEENYPTNAISFRTGINIRLGQGGGKNKKRKKKNKKKREIEN